jgi:hypothetical protein
MSKDEIEIEPAEFESANKEANVSQRVKTTIRYLDAVTSLEGLLK